MTVSRPSILLALAFLAAGAGGPLAAQAGAAPANPPAPLFTGHPYKTALRAIANYRSCGVHARAGDVRALTAGLLATEARARARGLGPALDRLHREYEDLMAISDIAACVPWPAVALAEARRALAAFRRWVDEQPAG